MVTTSDPAVTKHLDKKQKTEKDTATSTGPLAGASVAAKRKDGTSAATAVAGDADDELVEATLYRLTHGLPRTELQSCIKEAKECESYLEADIELLEKALQDIEKRKKEGSGEGGGTEDDPALDAILDSIFTPLDRYWNASALLGRLRENLSVPRMPTAPPLPTSSLGSLTSPNVAKVDPRLMVELAQGENYPAYKQDHETPAQLLALCKKVSLIRSAAVFKKPVKDEEAPGYSSRIPFPMDISLLRKMIVARQVTSYAHVHKWIGLISHNCVKFNGRESDYGLVAREFEALADEAIRQAVLTSPPPPPPPGSAPPPPSALSAPKVAPTITAPQPAPTSAAAAEKASAVTPLPPSSSSASALKAPSVPAESAKEKAPNPPVLESIAAAPPPAVDATSVAAASSQSTKEVSLATATAPVDGAAAIEGASTTIIKGTYAPKEKHKISKSKAERKAEKKAEKKAAAVAAAGGGGSVDGTGTPFATKESKSSTKLSKAERKAAAAAAAAAAATGVTATAQPAAAVVAPLPPPPPASATTDPIPSVATAPTTKTDPTQDTPIPKKKDWSIPRKKKDTGPASLKMSSLLPLATSSMSPRPQLKSPRPPPKSPRPGPAK